jgi:hypothetical protein
MAPPATCSIDHGGVGNVPLLMAWMACGAGNRLTGKTRRWGLLATSGRYCRAFRGRTAALRMLPGARASVVGLRGVVLAFPPFALIIFSPL